MPTSQSDDNFLSSLVDTLFSRRCRTGVLSPKASLRVKKSIRLLCYELFYMFHKGPHKFLSGTYPRPSALLLNTLVSQTTSVLTRQEPEEVVCTFKSLIAKLADKDELIPLAIFCIIAADLRPQKSVYGTVAIKDTAKFGKENSFNPRFPIYETDILESRRDIAIDDLSRDQQRLCSMFGSGTWTKWTENACTKGLGLSIDSTVHCQRQFLGAFTHLSVPPTDSGDNVYGSGGPVSLMIPVLSEPTSEHGSSLCSSGTVHRAHPSVIRQRDWPRDEEDEGYCGSASSLSTSRLALTDQNAAAFLRSVLRNLPPVLRKLLSNAIFPGQPAGRRASLDSEDVIAVDALAGQHRFRWENRGVKGSVREAPFLFESGPLSVTVLQSLLNSRFLCPNADSRRAYAEVKPDCLTFSQFQGHFSKEIRQQFLRDLILMRIGVQSKRFEWRLSPVPDGRPPESPAHLRGCFVYRADSFDTQCLGISERALLHCLSAQLTAGTEFRHLKWLASRAVTASSDRHTLGGNQVRTAFLSALDTWLRAYEASLQAVLGFVEQPLQSIRSQGSGLPSAEPGLLSLLLRLRTLTGHINFVASRLCSLSVPSCLRPEDADSPIRPAALVEQGGIALLRHLCRQAEEVVGDSVEATVRFLFKRACRPFILFLRHLLVDGVCQEDGEEFNLVVSHKYLAKRNITFWTKAFVFKSNTLEDGDAATGFEDLLSEELDQDILRCAKSVHLLKSVAPKHYLFQCRRFFPSLEFPGDAQGEKSGTIALANYLRLVGESARSLEATRSQQIAKQEFHRKELIRKAAGTRERKLLLIQAEQDRVQEARRSKQLALHADRKQAMDQAAEDKRLAREAEKASDRLLMQTEAHRQAHEEAVLAEARLALTSQYAKLVEQAEVRRIAAEERIREGAQVDSGQDGFVDNGRHQAGAGPTEQIGGSAGTIDGQPDGRFSSSGGEQSRAGSRSSQPVVAGDRPAANMARSDDGQNACLLDDTNGLGVLQTRFQQINAGGCHPREQCKDLLYPSLDEVASMHATGGRIQPANQRPTATNPQNEATGGARGNRNRFGHASDATVQQILYGSGSGPSCRPSTWAVEQEQYRLESGVQPDAVEFCQEVLEESPCLLPPLPRDLPDFTRLTHVEPSRRLLPLLLVSSKQPAEVSTNDSCPTERRDRSAGMDEHLPLQVLLTKVVLSPLTHYISLVDTATGHHMIYSLHLVQHFQCLQQLFLLQNGTFAHLLLDDGLFKSPAGLLGPSSSEPTGIMLHRLMQSTLAKVNAQWEPSEVEDDLVPRRAAQPAPLSSSPPPGSCLRLPRGTSVSLIATDTGQEWGNPFDRLALVYQTPWPVNLCLHPAVLAKYSRIFCHLVHLRFAANQLASVFRLFRQRQVGCEADGPTARCKEMSAWLFEMLQVVTGISAYMTTQVAGTGWNRLSRRLDDEPQVSLETLCRVHETYIDELMRSCLLTGCDREIPALLHSLLACAHRLHRVAVQPPGQTSWGQLRAVHATFRQHARFLRRRSARLLDLCPATGSGSPLGQLVDFAFGANDFYASPVVQ